MHSFLSINTRIRSISILHTSCNAKAALVVSWVLHACSPNAPGAVGTRACGEVVADKLEVVLVVDGPALAFGVAGDAAVAGGVLDYALA